MSEHELCNVCGYMRSEDGPCKCGKLKSHSASKLKPCPVMEKDTIDHESPTVWLESLARSIRAHAATCPHRRAVDLEELAMAAQEKFEWLGELEAESIADFIREWTSKVPG